MNVYPQLSKIAEYNALLNAQIREIKEKTFLETDGLGFESAEFLDNCTEKNGHLYTSDGHRLDNSGLVDDDYFCEQYTGYLEDDFYGTLYFKTDIPGRYVAIPFHY